MKLKRRITLIVIVFLFNYLLDRLTKIYAEHHFTAFANANYKSYFGDLMRITFAQNPGAFLSFGTNLPEAVKYVIFVILPLLVCVGAIVYVAYKYVGTYLTVLIVTIASGGIANIQDRIMYGQVTDFLNFGIGPDFRTGILNFADMSVTFGVILLLIYEIYDEKKNKELNAQKK